MLVALLTLLLLFGPQDTISDWLVNQFLARGLQYRVLLENQAGTDYPHLRGAKFADLLDTSAISVVSNITDFLQIKSLLYMWRMSA